MQDHILVVYVIFTFPWIIIDIIIIIACHYNIQNNMEKTLLIIGTPC